MLERVAQEKRRRTDVLRLCVEISFVRSYAIAGIDAQASVRQAYKLVLHVFPGAGFAALEYGITDLLRFKRISEARSSRLTRVEALEEVGDLVSERVFVTDLQSWHPPVAHVRLVAIGDVDASPASNDTFVCVIEVLETMKIMKIPAN